MIKYARLKKGVMLFTYKNMTSIADKRLVVPEGTIVEASFWSYNQSRIWIGSYCNICDKTDLEFLE